MAKPVCSLCSSPVWPVQKGEVIQSLPVEEHHSYLLVSDHVATADSSQSLLRWGWGMWAITTHGDGLSS